MSPMMQEARVLILVRLQGIENPREKIVAYSLNLMQGGGGRREISKQQYQASREPYEATF